MSLLSDHIILPDIVLGSTKIELFQRYLVKDIVTPFKKLWKANKDDKLSKIIAIMKESGLQQLPIYNNIACKYEVFLHIADILHFLIEDVGIPRNLLSDWHTYGKLNETSCSQLFHHIFFNTKRSPIFFISEKESIVNAIDMMSNTTINAAKFKGRPPTIPRLAVLDEKEEFVSVLTLNHIINLLYSIVEKNPPQVFHQSVSSLYIAPGSESEIPSFPSVVSVNVRKTVLEAFIKCCSERIHSVAIVDESGRYISCAEVEKMVLLNSPTSYFSMTLQEYCHAFDPDFRGGVEPTIITPSSTLLEVLSCLQMRQSHQVYVLNPEDKKCLGVISVSDILRLFNAAPRTKCIR